MTPRSCTRRLGLTMQNEVEAIQLHLFPEYDEEGTPIFRAECRDCQAILPVSEIHNGACETCWDYWNGLEERQALDDLALNYL